MNPNLVFESGRADKQRVIGLHQCRCAPLNANVNRVMNYILLRLNPTRRDRSVVQFNPVPCGCLLQLYW